MIWRAPALTGFAEAAGFIRADVATAVAVALAASGGDDGYLAFPWPGATTVSVGLWQLRASVEDTDAIARLRDPYGNAEAALAAFESAGASWTWCDGYRSGRWRLFVDTAERAARAPARADTVVLYGTRDD